MPCTPAVPTLRPVRADDARAMRVFVEQGLGASSRRNRFHAAIGRCSDCLAAHLTGADGQRHVAWVACVANEEGDGETIVGEARYAVVEPAGNRAELAVSVADTWQGRGVADLLMQALLQSAAKAGLGSLYGDVLAGNERMQGFMRRHGFAVTGQDGGCVQLDCAVRRPAPARVRRGFVPGRCHSMRALHFRGHAPLVLERLSPTHVTPLPGRTAGTTFARPPGRHRPRVDGPAA